jgi:hypothetical protein
MKMIAIADWPPGAKSGFSVWKGLKEIFSQRSVGGSGEK